MRAMRLNKAGRLDFERMVQAIRSGETGKAPKGILDDQLAVEPLSFELDIREGGFSSRYEMGCHLVEALASVERSEFMSDRGFWDWLALLWFDDFCPVKADGSRKKPSASCSYVMSEDYKRRYRHAVYVTWQLVDMHGTNAEPLLYKEPPVRGELTEQLMARQFYLSCGGLIGAVRKLYWDDSSGKLKKGAGGKSAGSARRLAAWLQQIEVTYDIFSLSDNDLVELVPPEFKRFLRGQTP